MRKDIAIATTRETIEACFPVMRELRPHLAPETFAARVQSMGKEGYELAFLEDDDGVTTVAGFRIFDNLCNGRTLYVDDLVTAERARSRGHGATMLAWLEKTARERQCVHFSLDSGTHRKAAHRFYLANGFDITDFHFAKDLPR